MAPEVQRAAVIPSQGGIAVIQQRPVPKPSKNQLLVKITASAINPVDWKIRDYGFMISGFPAVLGTDAAGIVEVVGETYANKWKKGDRVAFQGRYAQETETTFQEYAVVEGDIVGAVPSNVSDEQASTIPVAAAAAFVPLFVHGGVEFPYRGPTALDKSILIIGGGTSVAQYTIQLARIAGFSPIITTASLEHTEYLKKIGATHVISRSSPDAAKEVLDVLALTQGPPIKLVYDTIGLSVTQQVGLDVLSQDLTDGILLSALSPQPDVVQNNNKRKHPVKFSGIFGSSHQFKQVSVPFWKNFYEWLKDGILLPNRVEVVGGLGSLHTALEKNKAGVHALKLVIKNQE